MLRERQTSQDGELHNQTSWGDDVVDLGKRLRVLRNERGLTLVQLGEQVALSASHLSQIERGSAKLEPQTQCPLFVSVSGPEQQTIPNRDLKPEGKLRTLVFKLL